ncbi:hypothetical protein K8R14_01890 [bacterium]|nr:hypothetical protein [bacterium]
MNRKIVLFLLFGIFLMCCIGFAFADMSLSERYPGSWRDEFNTGISKALAKNKIRGCGEYKYRPSSKNHNEYLVRCTRDGVNWSSYIVWVGINKVMGPYKSDPSLD